MRRPRLRHQRQPQRGLNNYADSSLGQIFQDTEHVVLLLAEDGLHLGCDGSSTGRLCFSGSFRCQEVVGDLAVHASFLSMSRSDGLQIVDGSAERRQNTIHGFGSGTVEKFIEHGCFSFWAVVVFRCEALLHVFHRLSTTFLRNLVTIGFGGVPARLPLPVVIGLRHTACLGVVWIFVFTQPVTVGNASFNVFVAHSFAP